MLWAASRRMTSSSLPRSTLYPWNSKPRRRDVRRLHHAYAAALCGLVLSPILLAQDNTYPKLKEAAATVKQQLDKDYPLLDQLYKDIHAAPELSFQEEKTAARLAKE